MSLDSDSCRLICILPVSYIRVLDAVSPVTVQHRNYLEKYHGSTLTFPAVTLCNVNPQNVQRALHLLDAQNKKDVKQMIDDVTKLLQFSKESMSEDILKRHPELFDRDKIVARWTSNSHQIGEMLLPNIPPTYTSCSFDGVQCGAENFSSFASSSFGQCYTFNSGHNGSQLLTAKMPGKNNGLKLRLSIYNVMDT